MKICGLLIILFLHVYCVVAPHSFPINYDRHRHRKELKNRTPPMKRAIFLDLDDTIIKQYSKHPNQALPQNPLPGNVIEYYGRNGRKEFLQIRQGLRYFLKNVWQISTIFAFTRLPLNMAMPIIEALETKLRAHDDDHFTNDKIFTEVLSHDDCSETTLGNHFYYKIIGGRGYDLENCLIIDDNKFIFGYEPGHGLLVPKLQFGSAADNVLVGLADYLKTLDLCHDKYPSNDNTEVDTSTTGRLGQSSGISKRKYDEMENPSGISISEYMRMFPINPEIGKLVTEDALKEIEFKVHEDLDGSFKGMILKLQVLKELGRGNAGIVYKVSYIGGDGTTTFFALKHVTKNNTSNFLRNEWDAEKKRNKNYVNAAQICKVFMDGDVSGTNLGIADGKKVEAILMEYIEGNNLLDDGFCKIETDMQVILSVAMNLVVALDGLLKCKMIHGDIKPENIVFKTINGEKVATLIDFGCAGKPGDHNTVGSKRIMSPDHQQGKARKMGDDLWALMCILALPKYNGKLPWDHDCLEIKRLHLRSGREFDARMRNILYEKRKFEDNLESDVLKSKLGPELSKVLVEIRKVCYAKEVPTNYSSIVQVITEGIAIHQKLKGNLNPQPSSTPI